MTYIVEVTNPYAADELVERYQVRVEELASRIESETGVIGMEARMAALSVVNGHFYEHEDPETHRTVTAWRIEPVGAVV